MTEGLRRGGRRAMVGAGAFVSELGALGGLGLFPFDVADLDGDTAGGGGLVGGEDHLVGAEGVLEGGEGHVLVFGEGGEEGIELSLVGVVGDVAAVDGVDGEFAPFRLVEGGEFIGVEFAVEETAFASDEVGVEVVGLEAIDDAGAFGGAAVGEFEERGGGGGVFVDGEVGVAALGIEGDDGIDIAFHAEEESVHGVAAGAEETGAAAAFLLIPAVLAVPWADAVVVVDFAVVDAAEEAGVDGAFDGGELAAVADLEADAGFDVGLFDGAVDLHAFFPIEGDGFFEDEVFTGFCGGDGEFGVVPWVAGDVDDFEVGLGEEGCGVCEGADGGAVFGAEFCVVERALGEDGGDAGFAGGLEGGDVSRGGPAVADDACIEDFGHGSVGVWENGSLRKEGGG